jgi:thioredoxin 1
LKLAPCYSGAGFREIQMNEPIHVNDNSFEKTVLKSPLPVLVDFWAPWCAPCRMMGPVIDKIAAQYAGRLLVSKVDTDQNPDWAERYRVRGIPTLLFIAGGQVLNQQVGVVSYESLPQMVDHFLETAKSAVNSVN